MQILSANLRYANVAFRGVSGVIATAVLEGPAGIALVDPGPTSCLPALEAELARGGLSLDEVEAILLTHIHLDHAGATGTIARRRPGVKVYVHERGVRHLVDPSKLLASARQLYTDQMDSLWGAFDPVPAPAITALRGEEVLEVAGRRLEVAYTPGHAQHHVSYFDRASRVAFVGDVGGCRTAGMVTVMPPTPPPDIDLEAWQASVTRILAWQPDALFLTHFGLHQHPAPHLAGMLDRIDALAGMVRQLLADPALPTDEARQARFVEDARRYFRRGLSEADLHRLELAVPLDMCWLGLARYWSKRQGTLAAPALRRGHVS
jgi:glyoxylase-like metal-dependent hydrolase (beta-lactamase superfamily II)